MYVVDKKTDNAICKGYGADGLIGANILKEYLVTFDYINEMVYFKPNKLNRITL